MAHRILVFRLFGATPRLLLQALAPQLVLILGVQPADIAFVLMTNSVVSISIILLYPEIAMRASIGRLLVCGAVLSSIGLASIAYAGSFHALLAVFGMAGGIGWALLGLRCPQHMVASLPAKSLPINMRALTAGPLVSALIVPPAILWVSQFVHWQQAVLCFAAVTLILCLIATTHVPSGVRPSKTSDKKHPHIAAHEHMRVGVSEYAAIILSGSLAGFFSLHFVFIVDKIFENSNITAIALLTSGLTTLASVFFFSRMQASGTLFRNLVFGSLLVSTICLMAAPAYHSPAGALCLLAWPVLSAGYFMHSMSVAAAYDKAARISGHLLILHMSSAGAGSYLFSLAVQATASYVWPLRVVAGLSLVVSLLLAGLTYRNPPFNRQRDIIR